MPHIHSTVISMYCGVHSHIIDLASSLSDAQLAWRSAPERLPAAFFLWHLARWADHLQAAIPGMTPALSPKLPPGQQVWEVQGLSKAWRFDATSIGYGETGMHMDEKTAARLVFPPKDILLDYVRQAFAAADRAVQAVDVDQFDALEQPQPLTEGIFTPGGTVGSAILSHLVHEYEHLGMMEALLGEAER